MSGRQIGNVIRDNLESPDPRTQYLNRLAAVDAAKRTLVQRGAPNARVLVPYFPRLPMNTGDPASSSGVLIDLSELAPEVIAFIQAQGGGTTLRAQDFTVADGQTVFNLPLPPGSVVLMLVNDVVYYAPQSFTVAGQVVTWGNAFGLDHKDKVRIYF